MKSFARYPIILARLVIVEVAILFLVWWQAMANVIFTNTTKFRMSDPFTRGPTSSFARASEHLWELS